MPAPTALKQAEDTPLATSIPLPAGKNPSKPQPSFPRVLITYVDNDEEFLLDAPDVLPTDPSAVVVVEQDSDDGMAIDEEGRPRFAPAKDFVRAYPKSPLAGNKISNTDARIRLPGLRLARSLSPLTE